NGGSPVRRLHVSMSPPTAWQPSAKSRQLDRRRLAMDSKQLIKSWLAATAMAVAALVPMQSRLAAQEAYQIGVMGAITGPGSFLGDPSSRAAKLGVDNANATGGINGKPIEVVTYDTEASPDKSLVFAKKLIFDDKVSVILGPDFSGTVRAILPTTDE